MDNSTYVEKLIDRLHELYYKKCDLEKEETEIKAELFKQMQEEHIQKLENAKVRITYIDKSLRKHVDGKKLKEQFPDVYLVCTKDSEVRPYLRVQVLA